MSGIALALEAVSGVRAAQDELEQQLARMAVTGDPTTTMATALAASTKALNRLLVDVFLKVEAQLKATDKLIQDGRKPWTRDEMRMLIEQLDDTLMYRWTQFNRAAVAIGVGVALVLGAACGAGGWWYRGSVPFLAGVRAGAQQCQDRPDGSRLCWIPIWERLPPAR
jgi:hypothetical protein